MSGLSRRAVLASGAAGLAGLAGCTSLLGGGGGGADDYRSYGGGPHNRGYVSESGPTGDPSVRWTFDRAVGVTPAVLGDTVYTVGGGGDGSVASLFALSAGDGDVQWEYELAGGTRATPAVVDGTVYATDNAGTVHAVNAADGSERWTRTFEQFGLNHRPTVADGAVLVGVGVYELFQFGGLCALETADGSTRWRVDEDSAAPVLPAAADGSAYYVGVTDSRNELRSVSLADGGRRWREPLDTLAFGVAVGDAAYVTGGSAYDTSDGTPASRAEVDAVGNLPPVVGRDAVYAPAYQDETLGVAALDPSGERRWFASPGAGDEFLTSPRPPTAAGETLYTVGVDSRLHALSTADGSQRWRLGDRRGAMTPAVAGGVVYAPFAGTGLVAVDAG